MRSHERSYSAMREKLRPVVEAIGAGGDVRAVLVEHDVTATEFMELDSHPGIWGYGDTGWHAKVRRFRNHGGWSEWQKGVRS